MKIVTILLNLYLEFEDTQQYDKEKLISNQL